MSQVTPVSETAGMEGKPKAKRNRAKNKSKVAGSAITPASGNTPTLGIIHPKQLLTVATPVRALMAAYPNLTFHALVDQLEPFTKI